MRQAGHYHFLFRSAKQIRYQQGAEGDTADAQTQPRQKFPAVDREPVFKKFVLHKFFYLTSSGFSWHLPAGRQVVCCVTHFIVQIAIRPHPPSPSPKEWEGAAYL